MGEQSDHRKGYNGTLEEDHEEIFQRNGDLAAHDNAADLRHIDQLRHAGGGNHKAGELALNGAGDDAGKEHIRKTNDDRLAGKGRFRNLQQIVNGDEGQTQNAENRGVLRNDQGDGTHSEDHRKCAEPHLADIFNAFQEEGFDAGGIVSFFQSQVQAVLAGGHPMRDIFPVRNGGVISVGDFGQGRELGCDHSGHNTGKADDQIEGKKQVRKTHLRNDHQAEGNADGREGGGDDGGFSLGIETVLILLAGQEHADGTVAQPGSHTVQGASAGEIEYGAHDLDQQGTHEVQQTIVQKQCQQDTCQKEDAHQNGHQITDDHHTGGAADDEIRTDVKENHVGKKESCGANPEPDTVDGE